VWWVRWAFEGYSFSLSLSLSLSLTFTYICTHVHLNVHPHILLSVPTSTPVTRPQHLSHLQPLLPHCSPCSSHSSVTHSPHRSFQAPSVTSQSMSKDISNLPWPAQPSQPLLSSGSVPFTHRTQLPWFLGASGTLCHSLSPTSSPTPVLPGTLCSPLHSPFPQLSHSCLLGSDTTSSMSCPDKLILVASHLYYPLFPSRHEQFVIIHFLLSATSPIIGSPWNPQCLLPLEPSVSHLVGCYGLNVCVLPKFKFKYTPSIDVFRDEASKEVIKVIWDHKDEVLNWDLTRRVPPLHHITHIQERPHEDITRRRLLSSSQENSPWEKPILPNVNVGLPASRTEKTHLLVKPSSLWSLVTQLEEALQYLFYLYHLLPTSCYSTQLVMGTLRIYLVNEWIVPFILHFKTPAKLWKQGDLGWEFQSHHWTLTVSLPVSGLSKII
jgi:hypothetical protein